jgi:hypothetical protein
MIGEKEVRLQLIVNLQGIPSYFIRDVGSCYGFQNFL